MTSLPMAVLVSTRTGSGMSSPRASRRLAFIRAQTFSFCTLQHRTNEAPVRLETRTQLEIPGFAARRAALILLAPFCRVRGEHASGPRFVAASFQLGDFLDRELLFTMPTGASQRAQPFVFTI
jgi:hypothetical protein